MSDPLVDSATTRFLCAGVYADRSLRHLIIHKIHNDFRRRVAPSYGFDLVPIVRQAWLAWTIETAQLVTMAGCLAGGLVLGGALATVVIGCVILVWALLRRAVRVVAEVVRLQVAAIPERFGEQRQSRHRRSSDLVLRGRKRLLKVMLAGCLGAGLAPIIVSYLVGVPLSVGTRPASVIGGALVACAIAFGVARQLLLNALHRAETLRPSRLTRREQVISEQQDHVYVIYQRPPHQGDADPLDLLLRPGMSSPFIGCGQLVNRWLPPMTVPLWRPGTEDMAQREYTQPPFKAHTLVERLRDALKQLGTDPGAEHLPGLRVRDRIYVAQADFSVSDWSVLQAGVGKLQIWNIIDDHRLPSHHFLEVSAPIAGGELVATVLLRISLKGRCLSLDVATCALTRTPSEYHVTYAYGEHGTGAVFRSAVRSVLALPVDVVRLWRMAEAPVVLWRAWRAIHQHPSGPRRGRGIGPRVAVREETADAWENAELDRATVYDHMKIIEQRILKTTEDFLNEHKVDTSAFQKQATNIISSGVLNMGGRMEIGQVATMTQIIQGGMQGEGA